MTIWADGSALCTNLTPSVLHCAVPLQAEAEGNFLFTVSKDDQKFEDNKNMSRIIGRWLLRVDLSGLK